MSLKFSHKRKRLNLSIKTKMQFRMIRQTSVIVFGCLFFICVIFYYYSNREIGASFFAFHVKARNFLDMLWPMVAVSFLASLLIGVVASLFFPKVYVGPLYRIEEDLKQALSGDLTKRIRLRDGDEGQELAKQLNDFFDTVSEKIVELKQGINEIERLCADDFSSGGQNQMVEIKSVHARMKDLLEFFKVEE